MNVKPAWGPLILGSGFSLSLIILLVILLVWPALVAYLGGHDLPKGQSWVGLISATLTVVGISSYLMIRSLEAVLTQFSNQGVERKGLFRNIVIRWAEVTEASWSQMTKSSRYPISIVLRTDSQCIRITASAYSNPRELLKFIHSHLPTLVRTQQKKTEQV
jgi:hypothetical protein